MTENIDGNKSSKKIGMLTNGDRYIMRNGIQGPGEG